MRISSVDSALSSFFGKSIDSVSSKDSLPTISDFTLPECVDKFTKNTNVISNPNAYKGINIMPGTIPKLYKNGNVNECYVGQNVVYRSLPLESNSRLSLYEDGGILSCKVGENASYRSLPLQKQSLLELEADGSIYRATVGGNARYKGVSLCENSFVSTCNDGGFFSCRPSQDTWFGINEHTGSLYKVDKDFQGQKVFVPANSEIISNNYGDCAGKNKTYHLRNLAVNKENCNDSMIIEISPDGSCKNIGEYNSDLD